MSESPAAQHILIVRDRTGTEAGVSLSCREALRGLSKTQNVADVNHSFVEAGRSLDLDFIGGRVDPIPSDPGVGWDRARVGVGVGMDPGRGWTAGGTADQPSGGVAADHMAVLCRPVYRGRPLETVWVGGGDGGGRRRAATGPERTLSERHTPGFTGSSTGRGEMY